MNRLIIIIVSFLCIPLQAQQLHVCDKSNKQALSYATLRALDHQHLSLICNQTGRVDVSDFKSSPSIEVSMLGYNSVVLSYQALSQKDTLYLQKKSYALEGVEVFSLRQLQGSDYRTNKMQTISAKELVFYAPQTSADLLGLSNEVFIQKSQQGGGSPMMRGFSANRLLYTVDGVRMNTAIFRSGNLQNVISLDAYAMANTQVLLGANSVIYGSDAIGGVMAFNTKAPTLKANKPYALQFNTGTSSANQYRTGHLDLSYGQGKISALTSLTYNDYGAVKMGSHGPEDYVQHHSMVRVDDEDVVLTNLDPELQQPTAFTQVNLMQKVYFAPSEQWNMYYGFHYSATSDYGRYDRHLQTKNDLPRYAEWKYGPQRWVMNHFNVHYLGANTCFDDIEVKLAHQHFEESRISRNFNDDNQKIREERVDAFSLNADFRKRFNQHLFYYGIEGVIDQVFSEGKQKNIRDNSIEAAASRYPEALWASYAVFLSDALSINKYLDLHLGARYNVNTMDATFNTTYYPFPFTETSQFNHALTWTIGLDYRPDENSVLGARISTAFRSPNVDDMGKVFDSEPGSVIVPSTALKPEYAYNFEVRGKHNFSQASIEATFYYTWLNHAFVRQPYAYNGMDSMLYDGEMSRVYALQNAAHAFVYGASILGELNLPLHLHLSASYHYQYGKEETEEGQMSYARHVAPSYGRLRLKYHHKGLQAELYAIGNAEIPYSKLALSERAKPYLYAKDANENPYSPEWYTLNIKGSYQFTEHLLLNLGIENISDQRYRPYSSGLSALGRNYTFSLQLNF